MKMLPKALEIMLDSYAKNMDLKSWQCFSEGEGVCLKIRFRPLSHVDNSTVIPHVIAKYKKASPSQQKRDSDRMEKHQMKTRSQTIDSVEKPRKHDSEAEQCLDISTVTVKSGLSSVSTCSMIMKDSPTELNESPSRSVFVNNTTEACMTGYHQEDYIPTSMPPISVEELAMDNNSDDSDYDISPKCECPSSRCSYGSEGDPNIPVFICKRCSNPKEGTMYVCKVCLDSGGHAQHRKFLVPSNNT